MQQWNKGPRLKMAAMSVQGEDRVQVLLEVRRAGGRKANRWVYNWDTGGD
jgi:hypothetical protein